MLSSLELANFFSRRNISIDTYTNRIVAHVTNEDPYTLVIRLASHGYCISWTPTEITIWLGDTDETKTH